MKSSSGAQGGAQGGGSGLTSALQMGGGVASAAGQVIGGLAANSAGKYTRKVMRVNARNTYSDSVEEGGRIRDAARMAMGRQLVAQGGSGLQMGTGSALDSLRESAMEREIDLATIRRQAKMKADGFIQQGELARAQGKTAMIGGFVSGAATLMESAAKAFGGMPA